MYAIEERLVKLNTQLEQARNDLKSKLTKKNINFIFVTFCMECFKSSTY